MINNETIKTIKSNTWTGELDLCSKLAPVCKYKCCKFASNYIVLYPGEREAAGKCLDHLEIIDSDYFGGQKAHCKQQCNPAVDYKPLDCRSYPFFPQVTLDKISGLLKGKKCPADGQSASNHALKTIEVWNDLINDNLQIVEWLTHVRLVGYEPYYQHQTPPTRPRF